MQMDRLRHRLDDLEPPAMLERGNSRRARPRPRPDRSSASTTPGSVPPSARMRPHGSTTSEWPKVSRPFSCLPPCAAASTNAAVLDRAGAIEHVPMRLAGLPGEGGRNGQERAAGLRQRPVERGKAQVVADGEPEPAPRQVGDHGDLARPVVAQFAIALAVGEIDVEHVDLVVAGDDLALPDRSGTSGWPPCRARA